MRTGHIGEITLKGDNGFYTRGYIFDKPLDFLIDNGSTGSILSSHKYGPRQANLVLIAYASSEDSGEPAHPRSLARTFAARSFKQ